MSIVVLSSDLADPYVADAGDVVVVTQTAEIQGLYSSEPAISVMVEGTIANSISDPGIYFHRTYPDDLTKPEDGHLVYIGSDGFVYGEIGIDLGAQQFSSVIVAGHVSGYQTGIKAEGDYLNLTITGLVNCEGGFPYATQSVHVDADFATFTNSGQVSGATTGVAFSSAGSVFENSGSILGVRYGMTAMGDDLKLTNSGVIAAEDARLGQAMIVSWSQNIDLTNEGTISGDDALYLNSSGGSLRNSGTILASDWSIDIRSANDEWEFPVSIYNSGLIQGRFAISASSGSLDLINTGEIKGKISGYYGGEIKIINEGVIKGKVQLSNFDDIYRVTGDGKTSGFVKAHGGDDRLVGSIHDDRMNGGKDDDLLRGRAGNDSLDGSNGNDVLNGGAGRDDLTGGNGGDILAGGNGNDTMRGDAGADVFLFGANGGTDIVTDFEVGKDILRIADHTGGLSTLVVEDQGGYLEITYDGGVILLQGFAGAVLESADFDFV